MGEKIFEPLICANSSELRMIRLIGESRQGVFGMSDD
jgi:hypothetical protein